MAYKCDKCCDTTWIYGENGYRRCECFKAEYLQKLWENYGVKPQNVKNLNDYVPYDELTKGVKSKAKDYIVRFKDIIKEPSNSFGMFGQNGAGKSHICIAIGAALLKEKYPVVYMPYVEATKELKANANSDGQEHYTKLSNRFQKAKVLIIDDLFKDKTKNGQIIGSITEVDIKHFYPILNYRYSNNLPTIFSSECTPEMLTNLDEAQAGRILEMCKRFRTVFRETKYNYRLKEFTKKE